MKRFVILLVLITAISVSCKKHQNKYIDYNPIINASNDYTNAQQLTVRVLQTFFKAATDSVLLINGYNPDIDGAVCKYNFDTITDSVFYTLKYGSWGVLDPYGIHRGGNIYVNLNGNISDSLTKGEILLDNFYYEFNALTAKDFTIENTGKNDSGNIVFSVKVAEIKWEVDTARYITWNFDENLEQISQGVSGSPAAMVFVITGTFNGTALSGVHFETTVNDKEKAIVVTSNCSWLKNGEISLQIGENNTVLLLPDSANCKNAYQLWIDNLRFDKPIENFDYGK